MSAVRRRADVLYVSYDGPRRESLARLLAEEAIPWTPLRYHRSPTLPATAWDVSVGRGHVRAWARALAAEGRRGLVHARGYLPGLMGLAGRSLGAKLLFDMRGFWVDERIHGGYWRPSGLQGRIGRWLERHLLARADHLIVLTRRSTGRLAELAGGGAVHGLDTDGIISVLRVLLERNRRGFLAEPTVAQEAVDALSRRTQMERLARVFDRVVET